MRTDPDPRRRLALTQLLAGGALVALPLLAAAQPAIPSTQLKFPKGSTGTSVKGQVKGPDNDARDYVLRARAGQAMSVSLSSSSTSIYFNVLAPGSQEALFAGQRMGGSSWSGKLPADGDYTVRVYLNRAAARQGKSASYTLKVSVQ